MINRKRLFVGSWIALVVTSFGFIIRALVLAEWGREFTLSQEDLGWIAGAGLFPFAITIVLFSLVIDKIGYHTSIRIAFVGHVVSAIVTICAGLIGDPFWVLFIGTVILALSNGIVEAVINPVTSTLYPKSKTHHLNILHAGWPGGLVLAGIIVISLGDADWRWKVGLVLLPTFVYGAMLLNQKFPLNERVAAGVPYRDMIREIKRPLFLLLLAIMVPLAVTELGTDSWITALMENVLTSGIHPGWVLVYTSAIMLVLRFFAGPIVHRINPLGLLACSAFIACLGLIWLSNAGAALGAVFAAATFYALGKTFFWPTTLGVVAEQFPKGGALLLNTMGGMGMLAAGLLGAPILGSIQDKVIDQELQQRAPEVHQQVTDAERLGLLGAYNPLDNQAVQELPMEQAEVVREVRSDSSQIALRYVAFLPALMLLCYIGLILYFRSQGGYKPVELEGEQATGGVEGPVEA
ncbi:MAG: MFS transporter [Rhodothermales bacterium]